MGTFRNPVLTDDVGADHGDPFVLRERDRYLLYHTGGRAVPVYESTDLVTWTPRGEALRAAAPPHWAQVDLWAPEVIRDGDELLMYVAATRLDGGRADDGARRQGLARADDPCGPFAWDDDPLVPERWSIDAHPFRDEDGSAWLFYNTRSEATRGPGRATGTGNLVDRMLALDRPAGQPAPVAFPDARWEGNVAGSFFWNEGPWVLKRRGGYYQMYSGGFFAEPSYAVGGAFAAHPGGPWVKDEANPTFRGTRAIQGPGHHCVVTAPDGVTPYAVYHGRVPGRPGRKVHVDRLWWVGDRPLIAALSGGPPTRPTDGDQPRPPGPAYDPAVAHWRAVVWARGRELTVGASSVDLPDGQLRRVDLACGPDGLWAWVDGVRQPPLAGPGRAQPRFGPAGAVLGLTVTSCLEDESSVVLEEGESRSWAWGGTRPLELSLAVRGRVEVEVGASRRSVATPRRRHRLLVLVEPGGAEAIAVTAGRGGAVVSDLLAVTRDEREVDDLAAAAGRAASPDSALTRIVRGIASRGS